MHRLLYKIWDLDLQKLIWKDFIAMLWCSKVLWGLHSWVGSCICLQYEGRHICKLVEKSIVYCLLSLVLVPAVDFNTSWPKKIQLFIACRRHCCFDFSTFASWFKNPIVYCMPSCQSSTLVLMPAFDFSTLASWFKKSNCLLHVGALKYLVTATFLLWCLHLAQPRS